MNCCCCSGTKSCLTFCDPQELQYLRLLCPPLSPRVCSNSRQFAQTESVMLPNHLILCCSLLLPSIFAIISLFPSVPVLHIRWPNYWSFSFNISPSNEYSGLNSLGLTGWISLQSKGLSRIFSNTTVQRHQFFGAQHRVGHD